MGSLTRTWMDVESLENVREKIVSKEQDRGCISVFTLPLAMVRFWSRQMIHVCSAWQVCILNEGAAFVLLPLVAVMRFVDVLVM